MIVIISTQWNQTPRLLASRWTHRAVGILTPQDLSVPGWHQRGNAWDSGAVVVEQNLLAQKEISGVLTLLPCVSAEELADIAPADREYVATEMTAFLLFWLSQLQCPVLNRPTPTCLSGPYWRREKWVSVASQAGIPAGRVVRYTSLSGYSPEPEPAGTTTRVTVIGARVFGTSDPTLQQQAKRLARLAGVEMLTVRFSGPESGAHFVGADLSPDLSDNIVADAVLDYFGSGLAK
jgi:hypothetical protein